jgi:predicted phosphodiesterase
MPNRLALVQNEDGLMRIAVLSDIHGNYYGFEAALQHAKAQGYDLLVLLGDIVSGPDSVACWELACSLDVPIIRGNHERYLFDFATPQADPQWRGERFAPLQWLHRQFSEQQREAMRQLPTSLRLPALPDMLFVHASQRNDVDPLHQYTPDSQLEQFFPDPQANLIIRGHNHICSTLLWQDRIIVTAGSAGAPLNAQTTAQYTMIDIITGEYPRIQSYSVPYDVRAAVQRFADTGYLAEGGPMAELFRREVATASFYVGPFLRFYQTLDHEQVSLEEAVRRFLSW